MQAAGTNAVLVVVVVPDLFDGQVLSRGDMRIGQRRDRAVYGRRKRVARYLVFLPDIPIPAGSPSVKSSLGSMDFTFPCHFFLC